MREVKRNVILDELARLRQLRFIRPPLKPRNVLWFLISTGLAVVAALFLRGTSMPQEHVYMTGIFVLAALLWVTEALPLFATALLIVGLEIILLANPGGWSGLGFQDAPSPDYRIFLAPAADPVIILFFGGFLLARAAVKTGIDQALAGVILRLFRSRPRLVLLGLMLITAVFSMFMSNTATTAMMITLVLPMLTQLPKGDRFRKALVLSVPFAANIGGMGTPISSPPNAVAVGFLTSAGYQISFLDWMVIAVPLVGGLLLVAWLLLWMLFRPDAVDFHLEPTAHTIGGRGLYVLVVLIATVGLWMTDQLHGLPAAVVALLPAVAFTATGLLDRGDVNSLEWNILILIAGGIALGVGMQQTGLDQVLAEAVPAGSGLTLGALVLATLLLSTFMSNTAAANLLLPIGISFAAATSTAAGPGAIQLGISIALAASVSMALPVSTPPNAIAYASGEITGRDFALAGVIIGLLAALLIVALGGLVIAFWLGP
jgi:sodium-dependent dicarboxylate transporter 2/3/5